MARVYTIVELDTQKIKYKAYTQKELINYALWDAKNFNREKEISDFATAIYYLQDRDYEIIEGY